MKARLYTRLGLFVSVLVGLTLTLAIAASAAGAQNAIDGGAGSGTVSSGGGLGAGEMAAIVVASSLLALLIVFGVYRALVRARRPRARLALAPRLQEEAEPEQQRKAA